jgi:uncharacterized membrane protein YedE/YeeE
LIVGSICFGVGWGLAGLCPAPVYTYLPLPNIKIPFYWFLSFVIGFRLGSILIAIGDKLFGKKHQK